MTRSSGEKITVDTGTGEVRVENAAGEAIYAMGTPEAFSAISRAWLRSGWDAKYVYSFTWLGRPVIQLPEDLIRIQEVIYRVKPDVIIETGVAHGGSLVFYASLLAAMGHGRVIGLDIEIRPQNRAAIEAHPMSSRITLIEADSIRPETVDRVANEIGRPGAAFVVLDSKHTKDHVLSELKLYSRFVTVDSYIVVADGIMEAVAGAPRTSPDWTWNNPRSAIAEFLEENPDFEISEPAWLFNEGTVSSRVTYWPDAYLRRIR
ncbi:MAG TPA: CmcI family methyltransferase [Chthoniobacterales bacterium]|nr:CmcI family methyltransferase [Chthoniobacterales bacterium]